MSIEARGAVFRVRLRRRGQSVSATFDTLTGAEEFRAAWIATLDRGEAPPGPPRPVVEAVPVRPATVEDACREFVAGMVSGVVRTRRGHHYKASTIRGHENRLRLYVVARLGGLPLHALRRGDVRRLVDEVAVEASPATAANVRDALRLVLQRQVELEVGLVENVAAGVRAPTVDHAPARFLTAEEADRLQHVADQHRHPCIGALVATGLGTGLRLGELQALTWGEGVDLERGLVVVRATRDRTGELVPPKSRRTREVPLGAELVSRLRRYRMAAPRSAEGERVFWRSHRRAFEQVRDAAGLPGLRVHDLRHSAATFWLAAGLTVHAVADLLGHVDAALVLRLYGHALAAEVSSAAERLEAWRASQRGAIAPGLPQE